MFNLFKNKSAINFSKLVVDDIDYVKNLSYKLVELDDGEILFNNSEVVLRSYVATYLFYFLEHLKIVSDKIKADQIKIELEESVDRKIWSLLDEISNHMILQDFPYLKQCGPWIVSKLNLSGTLKAQAIAHQYTLFCNVISSSVWQQIGVKSYPIESIVELFANRCNDKNFCAKVLVALILSDAQQICSYENYRNVPSSNTALVIKNLNLLLKTEPLENHVLLNETMVRCDLVHHYARGVGDYVGNMGVRMQLNCQLLAGLV